MTILSNSAGRSSGYLVQRLPIGPLLVDCGPGVSSALIGLGMLERLSAVVLTHGHADHAGDVIGLAYALRFPRPHPQRIPLWAPPDTVRRLRCVDDAFAVPPLPEMGNTIASSFELQPLESRVGPVPLGQGARLLPFDVHHAAPAVAIRIECDASVISFSADTAYCDNLISGARTADLFFCEATYLVAPDADLLRHGHLTAEQAGRAAAAASVRKLVLTRR